MQQIAIGTTSPDLDAAARALAQSLRAVAEALPGGSTSPTALSQQLGLSRVTLSKMLSSLALAEPSEMLERIPGPESLREFVRASSQVGVEQSRIDAAMHAIDTFHQLIDHFGTRAALHAAIGASTATLRGRVEVTARGDVFKGMRQVLGIEANTWLTSMMFVPHATESDVVSVTTIHGALGLRRLRPDTPVFFTFGPPYHQPGVEPDLSQSPVSLHEFYTNEPAKLQTKLNGKQLFHQFISDRIDKHALFDMLAVSHSARGSRKYGTEQSRKRGVSLFVDTPVRMLVCDALIHRDLFPGVDPELIVYNCASRGPANPNDPLRDVDRVTFSETPTLVNGADRFDVDEVPNYREMVERVCAQLDRHPDEFRVHRLRMAYPIPTFQIVMAFAAPDAPST
jgi:hypothetical protein